MAILLALCIAMAMPPAAKAAGNPYPYWQTFTYSGKSYTTITCTFYLWEQVHNRLGIDLPAWGNAGDWLGNASKCGYQTGSEPKVNAIACWTNSGNWGHVGLVTSVDSNGSFTYDEGGSADRRRQDTANGIYTGHPFPDGYTSQPSGFIYLDSTASQSNAPAAPDWSPTLNFGEDFYAYIKYSYDGSSSLYLKNDSDSVSDYGKVTTGVWNGTADARYIWHCIRNQDAYMLINEFDGRLLDVYCGKDEDRTAIGLWESNGQTPQRWRFYQLPGLPASTFAMMPDSCSSRTRVADIDNGSTAPGGTLQLYSQNHTPAQNFGICKLSSNAITYSKPAKPSAPQTISTSSESNGNTKISWDSVPAVNRFDMREYEVVIDGISYTTKSTCISLPLSAGAHSVKVCAVNTNYLNYKSAYAEKTVTAAEGSRMLTVTVKSSPAAGGAVSGGGVYTDSEFITVTATPRLGYQFKEWQENGQFVCNSADFSFMTSVNHNLTAVFEKLPDDNVITGWIPEPQ